MDLTPPVLEAAHTRLEPLAPRHRADLAEVALDPELWRFTPTRILSIEDLDDYMERANAECEAGTAVPFATIERASGRAIGSTRFGNVDVASRRVEIGWSWLGREYQRRAFNTEAKLLLLAHAFDRMGCNRVELRVDALNEKSRRAVERLGAKEEGTLRRHTLLPGGRAIDWVYYAILPDEWPAVRARLEQKLDAHEGRS